jgi:Tol biopolymer transport system component
MATWWGAPLNLGVKVTSFRSGERDSLPIPGTDDFAYGGDWSPTGRLLALTTFSGTGSAHLWVLDLENKSHVLTVADSVALYCPAWTADGQAIYYLRDDELYRIAVDTRSGRARDVARRLLRLEDNYVTQNRNTIAIIPPGGGPKLAYIRQNGHWNYFVARVDAGGRADQMKLTTGTANKRAAALSPDGTTLAFLQQSNDGWDLYRVPASGGPAQQLTFGGAASGDVRPAWDASGQRLAFASCLGARLKVAVVPATGGQPKVFEDAQVSEEIAWAPSARIAYQLPGNRNYGLLDPGTGAEQLLARNDSAGWMFAPRFSPDGSRVAVYWSRKDGASGVWVLSLADSTQTRLRKGQVFPHEWSADGMSLYVQEDTVWRRLPATGGDGAVLRPPAFEEASCVPFERPSGVVWVCTEGRSWTDAWMIENFDPEYAVLGRKQGRGAQRRP